MVRHLQPTRRGFGGQTLCAEGLRLAGRHQQRRPHGKTGSGARAAGKGVEARATCRGQHLADRAARDAFHDSRFLPCPSGSRGCMPGATTATPASATTTTPARDETMIQGLHKYSSLGSCPGKSSSITSPKPFGIVKPKNPIRKRRRGLHSSQQPMRRRRHSPGSRHGERSPRAFGGSRDASRTHSAFLCRVLASFDRLVSA